MPRKAKAKDEGITQQLGEQTPDLEEVLGVEEEEDVGEEETDETGGDKKEKQDPGDRIAALEQKLQEQNLGTIARMAEIMDMVRRGQQPAQIPQVQEQEATEDELIQTGMKHPEMMPAILDKLMEQREAKLAERLEARMSASLEERDLQSQLNSIINTHYSDEIRENGEIIREAAKVKRQLAGIVKPEMRNNPVLDQLALLVAGGSKPAALAKRETARMDAEEKQRRKQLDRFRSMGIVRGPSEESEPVIGEGEAEFAKRVYGIDMDDPKVKARILKSKKEKRLAALDKGSLVGMVKGA